MLRMEIALFLVLCAVLLFGNWRSLDRKKRFAIGAALVIEFTVCALQGLHHTWLISGMGLTLMTLALYLTLENPDILRGELTEQKLSMLYLKSQVNPHFLYNTLDAIPHPGPAGRRQARGRSADAAGRFLPAERQGRPADGHTGRRTGAAGGISGADVRPLSGAAMRL